MHEQQSIHPIKFLSPRRPKYKCPVSAYGRISTIRSSWACGGIRPINIRHRGTRLVASCVGGFRRVRSTTGSRQARTTSILLNYERRGVAIINSRFSRTEEFRPPGAVEPAGGMLPNDINECFRQGHRDWRRALATPL